MKKNYVIIDAVKGLESQFITSAKFENVPTDSGLYFCPTFSPLLEKAKRMTKPQATKLLKEMKAESLRAFNEKKSSYKILQILG